MIGEIKGKTKKELQKMADQKVLNIRIWLQEHGELALGVGFLLGIVAMFATKLVVALFVIVAVGALVVWQLAPESRQDNLSSAHAAEDQPEIGEEIRNGHPDSKNRSDTHSTH
jgi:predicted negative regulator of RcsB-dependent stress response